MKTRTEHVKFTLTLDKEKFDKHRKEVEAACDKFFVLQECDVLSINYNLYLEYFGQCEERLKGIQRLIDDGVVVSCESEELIHGVSILLRMLDSLKHIHTHIAGKSIDTTLPGDGMNLN